MAFERVDGQQVGDHADTCGDADFPRGEVRKRDVGEGERKERGVDVLHVCVGLTQTSLDVSTNQVSSVCLTFSELDGESVALHLALVLASQALGCDGSPIRFDVHQLVEERKPLVVRLILAHQALSDGLATCDAPFDHLIEVLLTEVAQGRNRVLAVRGKDVLHVCVGFGVGHRRHHGVSAHQASSVCLECAQKAASWPPLY